MATAAAEADPKSDSVRNNQSSENQRLHHSAQAHGKLRHTSYDDLNAPKVASIPSKFATIVVENGEKRGFGSQARRFNYDPQSETPGPAAYADRTTEALNLLRSPSFSRKGTGGFASKAMRKYDFSNTASPGPGSYESHVEYRERTSKASTTRNFKSPIAVHVEKPSETPGPNAYNPRRDMAFKQNNVSAYSAFKSQTKREIIDLKQLSAPAPGTYNVKDDLLHDSVKVPASSFKTNGDRIFSRIKSEAPPPGTYHPYETSTENVNRLLLPRRHYLGLSVPAIPPPPTPPGPGPGQYELSYSWGGPRHYMSSSMFVSNSSRWASFARNAEFPGPAHYHPTGQHKQSHIFNADKKWVPA